MTTADRVAGALVEALRKRPSKYCSQYTRRTAIAARITCFLPYLCGYLAVTAQAPRMTGERWGA